MLASPETRFDIGAEQDELRAAVTHNASGANVHLIYLGAVDAPSIDDALEGVEYLEDIYPTRLQAGPVEVLSPQQ
jgi:hypothetical protein